MSRYREDPRYSAGNLAYRDAPPPPQRWDRERFASEASRYERGPPVDRYEDPYRPPPRAPVYEQERERYYEDDRYGPRGNLRERKIYEEDDYYQRDPRAAGGAMIPYAPARPARPVGPPRPGLLRRQSSLDTFDRRPPGRYDDGYDNYRPRPPPPRPGPGPGRYDDHDDVRVQDPDRYGDDGFREYREREWISKRRRSGSRSRSRSRSRDRSVHEVIKEEIIREEKPYPRRGKTRMPRRLVHTKVLYDLGYPYYEEDERTILVEKALGPDNIDEVFTLSKEYREREVGTTHLIEAPPALVRGSVRDIEVDREEVRTVAMSEAPRSVRDWDQLSARSPSPKSHRSRSHRRSRRGSSPGTVRETVFEKEEIIRESSPARTHRSGRSRHHHDDHSSHSGSETIVEKTKIITEETDFDESNSVHVGPLALVVDRKQSRTDRDIKDEIRRLERERREIRRERKYEREGGVGGEIIKVERVRDRSPSPRGEVVVERRGDEILEVRKDRRARARSAAPSPGIIKAMFATLT